MELEQRQVKTIDEAIKHAESLTDFKHERYDKEKGKYTRISHAKGGGDRGQGKKQQTHPKQHDPHKPDTKRFVHKNYTEKRVQTSKGDGCYICGGPHGYARCPEMKNLGSILRERKEKDSQEQGQDAGTTQLVMIVLCVAIVK